jgi:hypothetical protein
LSNEEESVWFTIAEKALGLLVVLIGIIIVYSTTASPALKLPGPFTVGGLAMVAVGIFMFLSKTEK